MKDLFLFGLIFLAGCTTTKNNYFPTASSQINFDSIYTVNNNKSALWTNETTSEFYVEVPKTSDSLFFNAIGRSFIQNGYKKVTLDIKNRVFTGQRGIRPNEWATLTRVYYQINEMNIQVYVRSEISQDGTGGWRENRAKKVAIPISDYLKNIEK